MIAIKFHEAAELEAAEAIAWYEENEEGLGSALRNTIETTIDTIRKRPLAYPVVHLSNECSPRSNTQISMLGRFHRRRAAHPNYCRLSFKQRSNDLEGKDRFV